MFNEKDHPRDSDGKFTDGNAEAERDKRVAAIRKYSDDPDGDMNDLPAPRGKKKSQDEFFGEEFKGYKGANAVEKLLKEKRGHVKNAFERPEINGGIDIIWGDKNGGLLHTILQRDKKLASGKGKISGIDMVKKIPEIMQNGTVNQDDRGRINVDYNGYRVGILPMFYDNKVNWIVTAMELLQ